MKLRGSRRRDLTDALNALLPLIPTPVVGRRVHPSGRTEPAAAHSPADLPACPPEIPPVSGCPQRAPTTSSFRTAPPVPDVTRSSATKSRTSSSSTIRSPRPARGSRCARPQPLARTRRAVPAPARLPGRDRTGSRNLATRLIAYIEAHSGDRRVDRRPSTTAFPTVSADGLLVGTIVLWLAAISRVVASIRRPDPARISMTVAAVCIAVAFTLIGFHRRGRLRRPSWEFRTRRNWSSTCSSRWRHSRHCGFCTCCGSARYPAGPTFCRSPCACGLPGHGRAVRRDPARGPHLHQFRGRVRRQPRRGAVPSGVLQLPGLLPGRDHRHLPAQHGAGRRCPPRRRGQPRVDRDRGEPCIHRDRRRPGDPGLHRRLVDHGAALPDRGRKRSSWCW